MRFSATITLIAFIFLLLMPFALIGDGPDPDLDQDRIVPVPEQKPKKKKKGDEGGFFAEVVYRDDIYNMDFIEARVSIKPTIQEFPGIKMPRTTVFDATIAVWLRLRGISVPTNMADRWRPPQEWRLERERADEGVAFLWDVLQSADYLIIRDPEPVREHYVCDAYVKLGGVELSLVDVLVEAGHARHADPDNVIDWGKRNLLFKKGDN